MPFFPLLLRTIRTSILLESKRFLAALKFKFALNRTTQEGSPFKRRVFVDRSVPVVDKHQWITVPAGLLEWRVYRGHSIGEQKHAKAKRSHVQRAGISLSTMTQQPLNLLNTHRLQPERVLCSPRRALHCQIFTLLFSSPLPSNPFLGAAKVWSHTGSDLAADQRSKRGD